MIRRKARSLVLLVATALLAACGAAASSTSEAASPAAARRDRSTITIDDMRNIEAASLYDVVQRLHPEWLTGRNATAVGAASARGSSSSNDVQVFLDNQRAGTSEILRQMMPNSASTIRYYSASEAQARFGNGNLNGVIQIVTAKR